VLDFDGTKKARRKDLGLSFLVLVLALFILIAPDAYQRPVRDGFRTTILRPFIGAQTRLAVRRSRTEDLSVVRAERDSLAALVAAEATVSEENRQLRGIIGLRERLGDKFVPAEVVRLGSGGAESTFIVNVGTAEGVHAGSPVMTPAGLLGVVWEVDTHTATAIDWSHSQFRASAMIADGSSYGVIEPRRGRYREDDLIALTGAPYQKSINPGKRVVTSGRGCVFPRGIMVGTISGIDEADTGWLKNYLVRPAVRPEEARHVLVGTTDNCSTDLSDVFNVTAPADTASLGDTTSVKPKTGTTKPKTGTTKPNTTTGGTL
jgi:rod shape-determining protein MreC